MHYCVGITGHLLQAMVVLLDQLSLRRVPQNLRQRVDSKVSGSTRSARVGLRTGLASPRIAALPAAGWSTFSTESRKRASRPLGKWAMDRGGPAVSSPIFFFLHTNPLICRFMTCTRQSLRDGLLVQG